MTCQMIYLLLFVISVQGACVPHASIVGEGIWKQLDRALSISTANKMIYQSDIPFTITEGGGYIVGEDLTNTGTADVINTGSTANILIDLQGHSIVASSGANRAVSLGAGTIRNGTIEGFPTGVYTLPGTIGPSLFVTIIQNINFLDCNKGIVTDISNGLIAENCTAFNCDSFHSHSGLGGATLFALNNCHIFDCTGPAFTYTAMSGVVIDECTVQGAQVGISVWGAQSIIVSESLFSNIQNDGIRFFGSISLGLQVENCQFSSIQGNGIVLGPTSSASIIMNSQFTNIVGNAINNAATSNGAFMTTYGCAMTNVQGIGINDSAPGNTKIYNNFFAGVGTVYSGASTVIQKTPTDVRANATNFWQNIVDA